MLREIADFQTGEIKQYTEEAFVAERDRLLMLWNNKKLELENCKTAEMNLRQQVVHFSSDPNKKSGTENIPLGNGWGLKVIKKINYGFVKTEDGTRVNKARIEAALQAIELHGPAGVLVAERLVKWTPDLSLTEYNQLNEADKAIIDAVIVTTEGAPTVTIVEPKPQK